jgi:hypothetical protein
MPLNGLLVERANAVFNRDTIQKVPADALVPRSLDRGLLSSVARKLEIARDDAEVAALDQWPIVLQDVIRAALHGAVLTSGPRRGTRTSCLRHSRGSRPTTIQSPCGRRTLQ